jgi:hypothetical protein
MVEGASALNAPPVERTALKEWAVLIDAMARGDIVAMVRKGGIREKRAGFEVRHDRFLLYPTFFHENPTDLAERFHRGLDATHARRAPAGHVRLTHLAESVAVWNVLDASLLPGVQHEHGLAPSAVLSRFNYRGNPCVRVVAVRVRELPEALDIPEAPRYAGCVSWLELDHDVSISNARPVLDEAELQRRVAAIGAVLGAPESPSA